LHQRLGSTIVYVTHDQIEAMTLATRIAVMRQGVVQQFADPETVYNRPANLFVARFMGAPPMNTLSARLEATADGTVAAIGQGEAAIRFPVPAGTEGWIGRDVVLGIRPECIAEPTRHFSDAPDAALTIAAPVEMIEPTGAETIVVLRIGMTARSVGCLRISATAGRNRAICGRYPQNPCSILPRVIASHDGDCECGN
jgi:multiple sugar transport system ATP-binding protein